MKSSSAHGSDFTGSASVPAPAFQLRGVDLIRGGTRVLTAVDITIPLGSATGITGASGSGKSSLLRLLNRFDDAAAGVVEVNGIDVRTLNVLDLRRRVGLVAQRTVLLAASVLEEVRVGVPDLSHDTVAALLARVNLDYLEFDRPTTQLSGGEAQRLALARALALAPDALLLDEPTSALDATAADAIDAVIAALVASGLTAVIVSHDLSRVRDVVNHAIVLDHGRVVEQGPPATVRYLNG